MAISPLCEAGEKVADYMLRQDGHFYVCGSARQVPEDIYTAMKEAPASLMPSVVYTLPSWACS